MGRFHRQRILADPERGDGHDAAGTPGDCLRAAVASALGERYEDVPHFAQHVGWWNLMRRWARARGGDFACVLARHGSVLYAFDGWVPDLLVASGPSPRGTFRHVVVVDADLGLVHDPHPSGAGLARVEDVLVYCDPYEPSPNQLALPAA